VKIRQIITAAVFLTIIAAGVILNIVIQSPNFIHSERRRPAELPELSVNTLTSGNFARDFEAYSTDNFAFREQLRTVRALTTFYAFMHSDKDGLFFDRRHGIGRFEFIDESQIRGSGERLSTMLELFPNSNVYFAVIPEKSFYTAHRAVTINPFRVTEILKETFPGTANFIELADSLTVEDFYRTDLHWCQLRIRNVIETLAQSMDFAVPPVTETFTAGEFFGVYYGQLAVPMRPDIMTFHVTQGVIARYMNEHHSLREMRFMYEVGDVYCQESFRGADPYSVFLRGPQAVVKLDTGNDTGRNLYIFRDSFGSSIAPLLAVSESYDNIVLIDLRYIDGRIVENFVDFTDGSDVLFLYSTQILNNASMFRGR
jgi:hypothetical protein